MINLIIIIMIFLSCIIGLITSLRKFYENYIRYKAIAFDEFQKFASAMDKTTGSREWRNNFKIFHKVYKAAKKARLNVKKNS